VSDRIEEVQDIVKARRTIDDLRRDRNGLIVQRDSLKRELTAAREALERVRLEATRTGSQQWSKCDNCYLRGSEPPVWRLCAFHEGLGDANQTTIAILDQSGDAG
jgi:hypothetical protein